MPIDWKNVVEKADADIERLYEENKRLQGLVGEGVELLRQFDDHAIVCEECAGSLECDKSPESEAPESCGLRRIGEHIDRAVEFNREGEKGDENSEG